MGSTVPSCVTAPAGSVCFPTAPSCQEGSTLSPRLQQPLGVSEKSHLRRMSTFALPQRVRIGSFPAGRGPQRQVKRSPRLKIGSLLPSACKCLSFPVLQACPEPVGRVWGWMGFVSQSVGAGCLLPAAPQPAVPPPALLPFPGRVMKPLSSERRSAKTASPQI